MFQSYMTFNMIDLNYKIESPINEALWQSGEVG
jgi:hypothetical protein